MALDTKDKRGAIIGLLPFPDGSFGQEDRMQMLGLFRQTLAVLVIMDLFKPQVKNITPATQVKNIMLKTQVKFIG